jgi:hypothetical protein
MRAWMPASRRGLTCRRQRPERGPSRAPLKPPPPHQPDEGRDTYDRDDPEAAGTDPPGRDVRARNSASRDGATRLAVAAGDSRSPRRETSDGTPRSISRFVQSEHVIRHMPGWEIPGEASALARHQTAPAASGIVAALIVVARRAEPDRAPAARGWVDQLAQRGEDRFELLVVAAQLRLCLTLQVLEPLLDRRIR